ncbi:DnaJ domain-containing protein [Trichoderma evansii]
MVPCQVTDDYYEILGVLQSAGKDDIRASYKRLALLHHPDRNPNNPEATAQFQLIEAAYSTLFDPKRRHKYDLDYASIRAQHAKAPNSSKSDPPRRTNDQSAENSQTFEEQMERLGAALQQLYTRRTRLDGELFETMREYNRSQAALNKLQSEADKDALEEDKQNSWIGYLFSASQSEEKEKRQRRMLNNRAARTVREAELNSRKNMIARKKLSIDNLNEQIKQKEREEGALQQRERARKEAVRLAEMWQREAIQREKERKEREAAEKLRRAQEEELQKWWEGAQRRREEQIRRTLAERVRKEQEAERRRKAKQAEIDRLERAAERVRDERIRKFYQAREAEKETQANVNWGTMPNMRRGSGFETESTNYEQSAGAAASKASCLHRSWWNRKGGKHLCERCSITTSRCAFRCPSCGTVACARCRDIMKSKK